MNPPTASSQKSMATTTIVIVKKKSIFEVDGRASDKFLRTKVPAMLNTLAIIA